MPPSKWIQADYCLGDALHARPAITCHSNLVCSSQQQIAPRKPFFIDSIHMPQSLLVQVVDDILDCTSTSEVLGKTAGKDLATDKTTYPSLLGLDRSKEVADELINAAHDVLSSYDPLKAAPLHSLAEYIRSRKN